MVRPLPLPAAALRFTFSLCLICLVFAIANITLTILWHWPVWIITFCASAGLFGLYTTIERALALARYVRSLDASPAPPH